MLPINTWKFLISGGMVGLLLSSVLMMIVLYRLSPKLQSRRLSSLRDQHIDPIPRYGGVALGFFRRTVAGVVVPLPATRVRFAVSFSQSICWILYRGFYGLGAWIC